MERSYSLNGLNLSNSTAESTCLNRDNGNSAMKNFPWGVSTISPRVKNNTSSNLNRSNSLNRSINRNVISPMKTKIDPRIYADVKAKGLASRIAQYHEDGKKMNRSRSTGNVLFKAGQFPIVHLDGSKELPYKAIRAEVSMTRIAPPKESMFYGNTISSLLRSSSIVGLQKTDEDILHENRPILHPPPSENDLAPTRSVIDVLQEISRKRINSDDPLLSETSKKSCLNDYRDSVDTGSLNGTMFLTNSMSSTFKRQREHLHSPKRNINGSMYLQHSPEQTARKRYCSYNNDISSSLSSSQIPTSSKRKFETVKPSAGEDSPVSNKSGEGSFYENQKSKLIKNGNVETLTKVKSCNLPMQTLAISGGYSANNFETNNLPSTYRTLSAPINHVGKSQELPSSVLSKPKVTLFNTKCDETDPPDDVEDSQGTDMDDEGAGIQFIKPKETSGIICTKNPLIEKTKQSKLAALLAGLKGELYQDEDVVDNNSNNVKTSNKTTSKLPSTFISSSINSVSSKLTTTTSSNMTLISLDTKDNKFNTNLQTPSTINTSLLNLGDNKNASSSVASSEKLSVKPPVSKNTTLEGTSPANNTNVTSSSTQPVTVTLQNICASTNSITSSTSLAVATTTITSSSGAASFSAPISNKSSTNSESFSFGMKTTTIAAATVTPQFKTNTTNTSNGSTYNSAIPTGTTIDSISETQSFINTETKTSPKTSTSKILTISKTDNITPVTITSSKVPTFDSTKPVFSFGNNSNISGTTSDATTSVAATNFTTSFGNFTSQQVNNSSLLLNKNTEIAVATTSSTVTTTSSVFGAPTNFASGTANFGSNVVTPTATKPFSFGTSGNLSVSPSTAAANKFVTSTSTSSTTSGGNMFSFGSSTTNKSLAPSATVTPFSFNNSNQTLTNPNEVSNNNSNFAFAESVNNTSKNSFTFGSNSNNNQQNTNNIFSNSATKIETNASTNANPNTAQFSFGSANAGNNQANITNNIFGSGTSSVTPKTNNTFGNVAQSQTTSIFGNGTQSNVPFSFGSSSTNMGKQEKTFSFGGNENNANKVQQQSKATNIFGTSNNNVANNSIFGSSVQNKVTNDSTSLQQSFAFGNAPSSNSINSKPSFGSLVNANPNQNQDKAFTFGSANHNNTTTAGNSGNSVFASVTSNATLKQNEASKPFSFGSSNTTAPAISSPFGNPSNTSQNNAPFTFGNTNNNGNNNSSNTNSGSIFGSSSVTGNNNQNKTFSFGSNTSNNSQSSKNLVNNIFGSGSSAPSSQNPSPAFNFSTGGGNTLSPSPMPCSDRVIRRATRRLQK